jgi:hypothetical protein
MPPESTITIDIPMKIRMTNRQKLILVPENPLSEPQAQVENRLLLVIAKGYAWRRRIEQGKARHMGEVAEQEKVSLSYVHALINLTYISPAVVKAIIYGKQPKGLDRQILEEMAKEMLWEKQINLSHSLQF